MKNNSYCCYLCLMVAITLLAITSFVKSFTFTIHRHNSHNTIKSKTILNNSFQQVLVTADENNHHLNSQASYDFDLESVFEENIKAHNDVIRQSEELFYGFHGPNGFGEFQLDKVPYEWFSYHLLDSSSSSSLIVDRDCRESETSNPQSTANIWEKVLELDKRVIPRPFTNNDLARISKTPILSAEECRQIIDDCENHYYGWGTSVSRYGTPTERIGNIIKLEDLSKAYSLVNFELLPRLFPAIANTFPSMNIDPQNLRLAVSRIVKYDVSKGRVELGLHKDGKLFTANIALNDLHEYEGGGTYLKGIPNFTDNPLKLKKGHVLLHPGDIQHGGAPITKGERYVLVCFIMDKTIIPHEKYCQDRMNMALEALRSLPNDNDDPINLQKRDALIASATKHCRDAIHFETTIRLSRIK